MSAHHTEHTTSARAGSVPSGPAHRRGSGRRDTKGQSWGQALRETLVVAAIALGISLLVKTFLAQMFWIPSQSMENTLRVGDRVVVSKLTPRLFDLERGDVVVFSDTGGWAPPRDTTNDTPLHRVAEFVGLLPSGADSHLIKRVVGLPGDHVVCCDAQGRMSVNGRALDESYVYPGDKPSDTTFDITVPEGRLWVMGDHRSASGDSRYHDNETDGQDGSVPLSSVTGQAKWVVWPFGHAGSLESGGVFDQVPAPSR